MAETEVSNYPSEGFERARVFYTVDEKMVLVKKNRITGRIRAKGSFSDERIVAPRTTEMYLHNLPAGQLLKLKHEFEARGHAEGLAKINRELEWRNANGTIPETAELVSATITVSTDKSMDRRLRDMTDEQLRTILPLYGRRPSDQAKIQRELEFRAGTISDSEDLRNATIKVKMQRPDIIRRKISTKLGIKFRWPWQSMMLISLQPQKLDTPEQTIQNLDNVHISFDTDYQYEIADPERYAQLFNTIAKDSKVNPAIVINGEVGRLLDILAQEYIAKIPTQDVTRLPKINLTNDLAYDIAAIDYIQKAGIRVTSFTIQHIKLPKAYSEAAEEKLSAEQKAKALDTSSKAKAAATRRQLEAEATKPQQVVNQIVETLSEKFPGLPPEQLAAMAAEIAKTSLSGQTILVQGAGNGMGPMVGMMAAAGATGRRTDTATPTDTPVDTPTDTADAADDTELDEVIEAYLDEEGYLNNRRLRAVVKELRGEDVVGDYQLSDLSSDEKRAVVAKINELEAAKRRRS